MTTGQAVKVTMEDGREVTFSPKQRMQKEVLIQGTDVRVRFDLRSGVTRTFDASQTSLTTELLGHGAAQKIGDTCAGLTDEKDMQLAIDSMIEQLTRGEWSSKREGSFAGASILALALMEYTGLTREEVTERLKPLSADDKKALRKSAELRDIVAKLEAARAAKVPQQDVAGLLNKFV